MESQAKHITRLVTIGLLAWLIPGAGHFAINKRSNAFIIFFTVIITFAIGLYIGSLAVIDPAGSKPWYMAQLMNSPLVTLLGNVSASRDVRVYGRPGEIGQIYTSIAGLLNLLCIVNAIYWAHLISAKDEQEPIQTRAKEQRT